MIIGAKVLLKQLDQYKILEKAFATYPNYRLTLTGHSLGAGLAVLLAVLIRPRYPDLKVYAFATPGNTIYYNNSNYVVIIFFFIFLQLVY